MKKADEYNRYSFVKLKKEGENYDDSSKGKKY
jgi:hypothetical protein